MDGLIAAGPFTCGRRPSGTGRKVIVLPGFSLDDSSTPWLRSYLAWLVYDARSLGIGPNLGRQEPPGPAISGWTN